MQTHDGDTWKIILITAAVAAAGVWLYVRSLRRIRALTNLPRSLLRSVAQGYVELHGTAHLLPGEPIVAPLTQQPCVWFDFKVEKRTRDSDGDTRWSTVESGISDDHFELRDETGHAVVNPKGAEVQTHHRDQWRGSSRHPDRGPGASRSLFASGDYRYTEQRIHEDDPIFVWGDFSTRSLQASSGPTVAELLREWKSDRATLIERFDTNKDGQIDGHEWDQARMTAEELVRQRTLASGPAPAMNFVSQPSESDRHYILSTRSEEELLKRYRRDRWLGILMFLIAGAICVHLLSPLIAGS